MSDPTTLVGLIDLLRKSGVSHYQGCLDGQPVIVDLGPVPVAEAQAGPTLPDPELCRCGHPGHSHGPFCLLGCEPEKCVDPKDVLNG